MSIPLAQWYAAVPDLEDRTTYRIGTCPCCGSFGLTLKRLAWIDGRTELEPFCVHGCLRHDIETEVVRTTAVTAPLGME